MYKGHHIAVVVPIHNEEEHLEGAIARIPGYVDFIVAVDDGSTDGTWETLCRLDDRRLIKLRHRENSGVGAATKTGYLHALQTEADLVAVMDGDGQMDGSDLEHLVEAAAQGVDYVKGNRFLDRKTIGRMPWGRYIGNRVLSWLTRQASGFANSLDAQCAFTVVRRQALARIDLMRLYDRYGFPNEMLFAVLRIGLTVECPAVKTIYGGEVSGINPFLTVPTVLWLIGRGFLRRKTARSAVSVLKTSEARGGTGD